MCRIVGDGGEEVKAAGFQRGEVGRRYSDDRDAEDGAGGRAQGLLVPLADGAGGGKDSGGAEGFSRADEGAEVAGILQRGGDKHERCDVRVCGQRVLEGPGRWHEQRGNALRGLRVDGAREDIVCEDGGARQPRGRPAGGVRCAR